MTTLKEQKLTLKEQKLVAEYVKNGGDGTKAALQVYDTDSKLNAAAIASKTLKKPSVAEALKAELERQGITMEKIISPVAKGLTAVKKDGSEDYSTQLAAHDRAIKIMGLTDKDNSNTAINFNINKANFGGEFVKDGKD